jgi:hypothetical protein
MRALQAAIRPGPACSRGADSGTIGDDDSAPRPRPAVLGRGRRCRAARDLRDTSQIRLSSPLAPACRAHDRTAVRIGSSRAPHLARTAELGRTTELGSTAELGRTAEIGRTGKAPFSWWPETRAARVGANCRQGRVASVPTSRAACRAALLNGTAIRHRRQHIDHDDHLSGTAETPPSGP